MIKYTQYSSTGKQHHFYLISTAMGGVDWSQHSVSQFMDEQEIHN